MIDLGIAYKLKGHGPGQEIEGMVQLPALLVAGRVGAREAVMKAMGLGLGAFGFHEVWVERAESGVPSLQITGRALELAVNRGITSWHLSLTHSDLIALAYVIAE